MLRYIYAQITPDVSKFEVSSESLKNVMELYITADKYRLTGLCDCAQECFTKKSVGFKMLDRKRKRSRAYWNTTSLAQPQRVLSATSTNKGLWLRIRRKHAQRMVQARSESACRQIPGLERHAALGGPSDGEEVASAAGRSRGCHSGTGPGDCSAQSSACDIERGEHLPKWRYELQSGSREY